MSSLSYIQSNSIGNTYIAISGDPGNMTTINMSPQESGKLTFINSNPNPLILSDLEINLGIPALSTGLYYKFIYNGLIASRLAANLINIVSNDSDGIAQNALRVLVNGNITAADGSSGGNNDNNLTLILNQDDTGATGVSLGDTFDCYCDGNIWYIYAHVLLADALTIA